MDYSRRNQQRRGSESSTASATQGTAVPLRILHLEDDSVASQLVLEQLRRDGLQVEIERVDTLHDFTRRLAARSHHLILSDFTIPGMDTFEALRLARDIRPDLPYVFFSGTLGEEAAVEALKHGAADFVVKDRPARLPSAIRRALGEARTSSPPRLLPAPATPDTLLALPTPSMLRRCRHISISAGALAALIGLLVLIGWVFDVAAFRTVLPGLRSMAFNTALALLLTGLTFSLVGLEPRRPWQTLLFYASAAFIFAWGTITLAEYIFGWNFGLGTIFHPQTHWSVPASPRGRPSLPSAMCCFLLGLLLLLAPRRLPSWVTHMLALLMALVGLLGILGHVYAAQALSQFGPHAPMALHTAVAFCLLALASLFARSNLGLMAFITSNTAAGVMLRRLLPLAILLPALLGWLRVVGQRNDLYPTNIGIAFFVLSMILLFSCAVLFSASRLHRDISQRLQVEKALCHSEARFRSFVESTSQIVWRTNPRGEADEPVPSWNAFTGQREDQSAGLGWLDAIHPDDRPRIQQSWKAASAARANYEAEYRLRRNDGLYRHVLVRGVPILEPHGEVREYIGACTDVTAQRDIEENLRRSEQKFRAIFEQAAIGIGLVNFHDARWIAVNEPFCRSLGYSQEFMRATPWPRITHPDDVELDLIPFRKMAAGEIDSYSVEKRFIHAHGHPVWARLTLSLVRDEQGRPDYEIAIIENIDLRKQIEQSLSRERAFLEAVLQACPAGIIVADHTGKLIRMNPANQRLWGFAPFSESVDEYRDWKGWWADGSDRHGRRLEPREWAMARALKGEACPGDIVEIEPFGSPGVRRTMFNSAAPVRGEHGEILGAVIVQIDITEQKKTEEDLRRNERRLRVFFESDMYGALYWTAAGDIPDANQKFLEMIGFTREEFQAQRLRWTDITPPEYRQADELSLSEIRARGANTPYEKEFIRKDGSRFPVIIGAASLDDSHTGGVAFVLDNTHRKRAETSAAELRRKLDASLLAGEIGIFEWDLIHDRFWGDSNFARFFDVPLDENSTVSISTLMEVIHPDDRPIVNERIRYTIDNSVPYEAEYRIIARNQIRWVVARATAQRDDTGRPARFPGVLVDITERKRAEALLHAALRNVEHERLRLATVLDALPVGVAIADSTGKVTHFNAALTRIWGTPPVARNIADYAHWRGRWPDTGLPLAPDDWAMARTLRTGQVIPGEIVEIEKFDGSGTAAIINTAAPIHDPDGRIVGGVVVEIDITEQRRAQEALRQSEERFRSLFNAIDQGFCVAEVLFDQDRQPCNHRFLATNPSFSRLLHTGDAEGKTAHEVTPDIEHYWFGLLGKVALSRQPLNYEHHVQAWNRWFEGFVFPLGSPEKHHVGILFRDVTTRKQAEQDLERRNQHLHLLHQASARLLVGQQPVQLLRQLHAQFSQVFGADAYMLYQAAPPSADGRDRLRLQACAGFSEEEQRKLESLRYGRAICAHPAEALQPIIATRIQTNNAPNRRFLRKLGFRSYLYYPLILNNHLHGTVAFASRHRDDYDRTDLDFFHTIAGTLAEALERERLESELQRHAVDLERKVQERTARLQEMVTELEHFSYTITHDMRTPLRAMRGLSAVLLEDCRTYIHEEHQEYLQRIADAADRMDKLITDALQYSTVVRGEYPLYPVDSGALLASILESYPQFHAPHADISIEGSLPVVLANEAGLTQCFSNLLGNAVKFVHPGQTPRVRIWADQVDSHRQSPPPRHPHQSTATSLSTWHIPEHTSTAALPASLQNAPLVRIWFEDRGIGIEKQYLDKIWVTFQRLNKSYTGTGIGLALVRKAVERMGGRVGVESELGRGSRFWVELRSAESPPLITPPAQAASHE